MGLAYWGRNKLETYIHYKINYDIGSVTLFIKMYNVRVHGRPCGGSICPVMGRLSELT